MSRNDYAKGFLLLTLPNCTLTTPSTGAQTGYLALQCVTLDIPSTYQDGRDVWLVLKLNSFEMIISPTQRINYSRSTYTYMFLPEVESAGVVQLVAPLDPSNPVSVFDLETMEVILSQYGVLYDIEGPNPDKQRESYPQKNVKSDIFCSPGGTTGMSDFKGHLVLVDEKDGEIVATLDDAVLIKEDKALTEKGHEKDPVVIDLPDEAEEQAGRIEAYAHPASPEERDLLMQTAGLISRGIILATSMVATGINSASNYYISHSTPTQRPIEFSPRTRNNMRRLHKVSGTAVTVSSKTVGAILETLDYVVDRLSGPSQKGVPGSSHGQLGPPPLPPRNALPMQSIPGHLVPGGGPPLPPRKPGLLNSVLASTDLLLTTLERSAQEVIETGTNAVSASLAHKYGQDVADATMRAGQSVQNVALVYIDIRGVGRRALLRRAGRAAIRARMGGRDVVLGLGQGMPTDHMNAQRSPFSSPGAQPTLPPAYSQVMRGGTPPIDNDKN